MFSSNGLLRVRFPVSQMTDVISKLESALSHQHIKSNRIGTHLIVYSSIRCVFDVYECQPPQGKTNPHVAIQPLFHFIADPNEVMVMPASSLPNVIELMQFTSALYNKHIAFGKSLTMAAVLTMGSADSKLTR